MAFSEGGAVKIAACYPRAVGSLPRPSALAPEATEVLNMRVQSAEEVCAGVFSPELKPNLPQGKITSPTPADRRGRRRGAALIRNDYEFEGPKHPPPRSLRRPTRSRWKRPAGSAS